MSCALLISSGGEPRKGFLCPISNLAANSSPGAVGVCGYRALACLSTENSNGCCTSCLTGCPFLRAGT